jgi:hypothetical protein
MGLPESNGECATIRQVVLWIIRHTANYFWHELISPFVPIEGRVAPN